MKRLRLTEAKAADVRYAELNELTIVTVCFELISDCQSYQDYVYQYTKVAQGESKVEQKKDRCAHKKLPLIVGGESAQPREFPHMALIGYGTQDDIQYICGGSLIAERWVLTAGHCSVNRIGPASYVRLGEHDKTNHELLDVQIEDFTVAQIVPHPDYRSSSHYNDIALLQLDRDAQLGPYVRPICLPDTANLQAKQTIASGWGKVGWDEELSNTLLKVTLELFPFNECYDSFSIMKKLPQGINNETQMCAGSRASSGDTCQGDSGGPLQVFHSTLYCMYTQIGVTSFGKACGLAGQPAVYTKVHPFVPWIESVVWPN